MILLPYLTIPNLSFTLWSWFGGNSYPVFFNVCVPLPKVWFKRKQQQKRHNNSRNDYHLWILRERWLPADGQRGLNWPSRSYLPDCVSVWLCLNLKFKPWWAAKVSTRESHSDTKRVERGGRAKRKKNTTRVSWEGWMGFGIGVSVRLNLGEWVS